MAEPCRLAEPGILLHMVGHDPSERQVQNHSDLVSEPGVSRYGDYMRALLALAAGAVGIGAFFASLAMARQVALESGAAVPSASWLRSCRDWLPWLCIGFGFARLAAWRESARTALRGLAIGAVFALALGQAATGSGFSWLPSAVSAVLGLVLGLHCESARRTTWVGVVVAGLAAVATAFAVLLLPPEWGGGSVLGACALGLALLASLVALVLDAPRAVATARPGQSGWLLAAGWAAVVVAVGFVALQTTADDWILVSGLVAVVVTAAAASRLGLAFGAAIAAVAMTAGLLTGDSSLLGVGHTVGDKTDVASSHVLRQCGDAEVVYLRENQELQLRLDGEVVAAAGPDRSEEPLLAAILHSVVNDGDRVLLLGSGTGRVEASLASTNRCDIEVGAAWPELAALQPTISADGPVLEPSDNNPTLGRSWSRALTTLPDGSRQVVVLGELPSSQTAHRATRSFQRQLRRVVGDGVVCQPIALDRVSVQLLESWFEAASEVHPWNGIYAVGNAAVLVSGVMRPSWRGGFVHWAEQARWAMHAAHLGGPKDLEVAFLGALKTAAVASSRGKPDRDVARQLMRWLTIPVVTVGELGRDALGGLGSESQEGPSLLRRWQRQQSDVLRAKGRLRALTNTAEGRRDAQAIAAQFLPMGAPAPWLQAALGLAGPDGVALRDASLASRCAFAMDPTFFESPAPVYATLPLPNQKRGDLEDLYRLDDGKRLVRRCSGTSPQAVAVRVRFPSRCARSLVAALASGTLNDDAALALRELADPFVLVEAARVLAPEGRWRELLTFWRADLPCPSAVLEIAENGSLEDRMLLASALRGRREPSCYPVIAGFLCADELELRKVAGEALRMAVDERIPFDANWPRSRRLDAASRLLVLHNRKP